MESGHKKTSVLLDATISEESQKNIRTIRSSTGGMMDGLLV